MSRKINLLFLSIGFVLITDGNSQIGISGETNVSSILPSVLINQDKIEPPAKIGVIGFSNKKSKVGVLAEGGLFLNSGNGRDSMKQTFEKPLTGSFYFGIGPLFRVINSEKAGLGVYSKIGLSVLYLYATDNPSLSWGTYYKGYTAFMPSASVGLEPFVYLNDNFSLYTNFGIKMLVIPNSQVIDRFSPDYQGGAPDNPLREKNDGSVNISVEGLGIGVRFYL